MFGSWIRPTKSNLEKKHFRMKSRDKTKQQPRQLIKRGWLTNDVSGLLRNDKTEAIGHSTTFSKDIHAARHQLSFFAPPRNHR
jgi:hypothetical protein